MAIKMKAKDIVAKMKEAMKVAPKLPLVTKPTHRERDMRKEAMDLGSHGAKEYFGGSADNE